MRPALRIRWFIAVVAVLSVLPAVPGSAEAPEPESDRIQINSPSPAAGLYFANYSSAFDYDGFEVTGLIQLPQGGNEDGCDPIFGTAAGAILLLAWDPNPGTQDCDDTLAVAQAAAVGAAGVLLRVNAFPLPQPTGTSQIPAASITQANGFGIAASLPATGRIAEELMAEDPPPFAVSVGAATVPEGDGGTFETAVTVTLNTPLAEQIAVQYQVVANGSATGAAAPGAGVDFVTKSAYLTIPAGQTWGLARFQVSGDTAAEGNETFAVKLLSVSGPPGGALADPGGQVTIRDDDSPSKPNRVMVGNAYVWEGNSGLTLVRVPIVLSTAAPADLQVVVATENLTAVGGAGPAGGIDYQTSQQSILVQKGRRVVVATFTVFGDLEEEAHERFRVKVLSAPGSTIGAAGFVEIKDDIA